MKTCIFLLLTIGCFNLFSQGTNNGLTSSPLFIWPIEKAFHDETIIMHYVDNDKTSDIKDYMGNSHSYDGHYGTDIALKNFRQMDKGVEILAAASGKVIQVIDSLYDRNMGDKNPGQSNLVILQHSNGIRTAYYHIRKNSATVNAGEEVKQGQVIALVGSSGSSSDPHLHFEVLQNNNGIWEIRDPFNGTYNKLPGMWMNQEPYIGNDHIKIYDMGIFTKTVAGGNFENLPFFYYKEKLTQPAVFGINESHIALWIQLQAQPGDITTFQIIKPDHTIFASKTNTVPVKIKYGWFPLNWDFTGHVTSDDYGKWTARIASNGKILKEILFEVGPSTIYAPRFYPVCGRSFKINGIIQHDTLRVSKLSGPVKFNLLNAPDFVTLKNDSIVTIGAKSNQAYRSLFFQAIAADNYGRKDTMWYHIVNPAKPLKSTSVK